MTPTALIQHLITTKIYGAVVRVVQDGGLYRVVVRAEKLDHLSLPDRQGVVYNALEKAPLTLIAKINAIECPKSQ